MRRRLVLVGLIVLAIMVVLVTWWSQSSPDIVTGSQVGPSGGMAVVDDPDPAAESGTQVWRQTATEAWGAWTVRNDGRYPLTLTSAVPASAYAGTGLPRQRIRFLAAPPHGGTPEGLTGPAPTGLVDELTIAPGAEGFLVGEVYFPAQCLAPRGASTQDVTTYGWSTTSVVARVLGRSSTLPLALPRRIDTPTLVGDCPLEAFGGR